MRRGCICTCKCNFLTFCIHRYFDRIEHLLRRSLGVSETAETKPAPIRPAPPVEEGPFSPKADDDTVDLPPMPKKDEDWEDWAKLRQKLEKDGAQVPPEAEGAGASGAVPPVVSPDHDEL